MPRKNNPRKLNKLQLKTLTLLQEFAKSDMALPGKNEGEMFLTQIPQPHQDHFHVGKGVIFTKDATGLSNPNVWSALERKGFIRSGEFPFSITITPNGLSYDTGIREKIIHGSGH